jgi:hypothetical protein
MATPHFQQIDAHIYQMLASGNVVKSKHQWSKLMDRHISYAGTIERTGLCLSPASLIRLATNLRKLQEHPTSQAHKRVLEAVSTLAINTAIERAQAV